MARTEAEAVKTITVDLVQNAISLSFDDGVTRTQKYPDRQDMLKAYGDLVAGYCINFYGSTGRGLASSAYEARNAYIDENPNQLEKISIIAPPSDIPSEWRRGIEQESSRLGLQTSFTGSERHPRDAGELVTLCFSGGVSLDLVKTLFHRIRSAPNIFSYPLGEGLDDIFAIHESFHQTTTGALSMPSTSHNSRIRILEADPFHNTLAITLGGVEIGEFRAQFQDEKALAVALQTFLTGGAVVFSNLDNSSSYSVTMNGLPETIKIDGIRCDSLSEIGGVYGLAEGIRAVGEKGQLTNEYSAGLEIERLSFLKPQTIDEINDPHLKMRV